MRTSEVFDAASVAAYRTSNASNNIPYLGQGFFPNDTKVGIDLKWIKTHKGLGVALKPANFDALPTVRSREKFNVTKTQMAFFREEMDVREEDEIEIMRAQDANDPFLANVLADIYNDVDTLFTGAEVVAEQMRMQLIAPTNGKPSIVLEADNVKYEYDYDPTGAWQGTNYKALSGTSTWNNASTATPLTDIRDAKKVLSKKGIVAKYIVMNSTTFEYLVASEQVRKAILAQNGSANIFMDDELVANFLKAKTGLTVLIYDKMYVDYAGAEQNFYPDNFVSIIGEGQLGKTWRGTTPEMRTLMGNPEANVAVVDGISITVLTPATVPAKTQTIVSQLVLPSFEGMDAVYALKVK